MQKYYGTNIVMENHDGIDLVMESVIWEKYYGNNLIMEIVIITKVYRINLILESVIMEKVLWHWLNYRKCAYGNSIMASITSILESIIAEKVSGIHIIIESLIVAKILWHWLSSDSEKCNYVQSIMELTLSCRKCNFGKSIWHLPNYGKYKYGKSIFDKYGKYYGKCAYGNSNMASITSAWKVKNIDKIMESVIID